MLSRSYRGVFRQGSGSNRHDDPGKSELIMRKTIIRKGKVIEIEALKLT